jgi:hypothetical protein
VVSRYDRPDDSLAARGLEGALSHLQRADLAPKPRPALAFRHALESALVFLQEVNTICCGRRSDPFNHAMPKMRKP